MTHLHELYDAVKAGNKRGIIENAHAIEAWQWLSFFHAATGDNTQAAIDFVQAALPEALISVVGPIGGVYGAHVNYGRNEHADAPARALLLAALAAMIAKGEG